MSGIRSIRSLVAVAALLAGLAASFVAPRSALAQQKPARLALVVGNGAYGGVSPLANPARDAQEIGKSLTSAGFDVTLAVDQPLAGLRGSLDGFFKKVEQGDGNTTALVFYAGHAIQLEGVNYLLPTDAKLTDLPSVARQAVSLSDILKRLDGTRSKTKIVILDACRDNPFQGSGEAGPRGLSAVGDEYYIAPAPKSELGLARIESRGGTLVAFSTSPGATALDGTGAHSPYAAALIEALREPGLPAEQVFKRVRVAVHDATNGAQIPWETSSLTANFVFAENGTGASNSPLPAGTKPTKAVLAAMSSAEAYRTAVTFDDPAVYRAFLDAFPDDVLALKVHRVLALRQDELAWIAAVGDGSRDALQAYMAIFPGSSHLAAAEKLSRKARPRKLLLSNACPVPAAPGRRAALPEAPARRGQPNRVRADREIEIEADDVPATRRAAPRREVVVDAAPPVAEPQRAPRWRMPPAYMNRAYGGVNGSDGGTPAGR